GRRADEGDGLDVRMVEYRVDRLLAPVDQAHHAGGEAGLLEQPEEELRGHGDLLAGFEEEAVAGRHGVRHEPQRDHAGEVDRRDGGDDAQRLPDHVLVYAVGDVLVVRALHHDRGTTGDLYVLD